jgi:mannose-6-phosphate isomerase-like protein (cupin superfamily)
MKKVLVVNPEDVEPIKLTQRVNFKLVDPTTTGSEHLTLGMVIVEPKGVCKPAHSHGDQEEIFFCVRGEGLVVLEDSKVKVKPYDAVFIPKGAYHGLENPHKTPLEVLWIISPPGWPFDKHPELKEKAVKGED